MPNNVTIAKLQDKSVTITSNGTTTISPDTGYTAMHSVSVDVDIVPPGQINFYDYDGTLVVSYTGEEVQALSALPNAPDHSDDEVPLTFDEWNWSLTGIKAYNTSYPSADIYVGANYHTTDGKNHFYFNVTSNTDGNGVEITLQAYSQGDTVDWGDGSAIETISSTTLTHIYTSIGEYHCIIESTSTYYEIGGGKNVYGKCEKLIKVYFSNNVTSLESMSFYNCISLQSMSIPNTIANIYNYAFNSCFSLKSITIPNGVTSIGSYAFNNCMSLQSVAIPNTITAINGNAFVGISLKSITIPSGVTTISYSVFAYSFLQSITLPNTVTTIASGAFNNCQSIKSVNIQSGVTSIASDAFKICSNLQSILIPNTVISIGNYAFYRCYFLKSITIPSSVTSIGSYAFSGCYLIKSVEILGNITNIDSNTFADCTSLQSILIPNSVTSIGYNAFSSCYSLQSITIPSGVTSIGNNAFNGCRSLYSVTLLPTIPPTLSNSAAFSTTYQKKFYVPYSADHSILNAYKTASNWSTYADYMEELPQA